MLGRIKDIFKISAKCDFWGSANSNYYPQTGLKKFNWSTNSDSESITSDCE